MGKTPNNLLSAFVRLIPKERPETASDFKPIALLNVSFKVIFKVLVNRLRPIMQIIIGQTQNSFLPGRSTLDNIILTQEVVHYMNRKKGKKGLIVVKLDIHKVYDSINWNFLERVLEAFGFPKRLLDLILLGIRNSDISVMWNGEKLNPFKPKCWLRQGNPLAPYLFNLIMECLSVDILNEVSRGQWKPITLKRGRVGISHLFFCR